MSKWFDVKLIGTRSYAVEVADDEGSDEAVSKALEVDSEDWDDIDSSPMADFTVKTGGIWRHYDKDKVIKL